MKRLLSTLLLGGLLCGATAFAQTPIPCPTDAGGKYRCAECSSTTSCTWWSWNFLNPSMETSPWEQYSPNEGRHNWMVNPARVRTGTRSLTIYYPDEFPGVTDENDAVDAIRINYWRTRLRIPATAGATYAARVYATADGMDGNVYGPASASLVMRFQDANAFLLGSIATSNSLSTTTQTWTALDVPATVAPANTDRLYLEIRLRGNGTAYYDDLSVWNVAAPSINLLDVQPTH